MNFKITPLILASSFAYALGAFTLDNVTARQRQPWSELVDISFEVNGGAASAKYKVDVTATCAGGVKAFAAKRFVNEPVARAGANRITWDLAADYPNVKASDFTVSVTAKELEDSDGVYCVIDLAGGKDATMYPVRYTTAAPAHTLGATNETSMLTELWLRRVHPDGRPFVVGSAEVPSDGNTSFYTKLTKDYYLGIFEVTQQQWFQLTGTWPSRFSNEVYRAARPLDRYYPYLFFGSNGYKWPDSQTPQSGSLWETLRAKTGLATIGLPTDAQWAFAAYAGAATGTMSKYYLKPDGTEYGIDEIARYSANGGTTSDDFCDCSHGTAAVGSYLPNNWGFYDMVGNVSEDGVDPYVNISKYKAYYVEKDASFPITDPIGIPQADAKALNSNQFRALRLGGGGYVNNKSYQGVYYRSSGYLAYPGDGHQGRGLRLCVTCE